MILVMLNQWQMFKKVYKNQGKAYIFGKVDRLNNTSAFVFKKTNVTPYPNICSLKTAIEEELNKMSKEFILKECKSFQRGRGDTKIASKKRRPYYAN